MPLVCKVPEDAGSNSLTINDKGKEGRNWVTQNLEVFNACECGNEFSSEADEGGSSP